MTSDFLDLESSILSCVLFNDEFHRSVSPFLKSDYFESDDNRIIYRGIEDLLVEIPQRPKINSIILKMQGLRGVQQDALKEAFSKLKLYVTSEECRSEAFDLEFLTKSAEEWCRHRAFYNTMLKGAELLSGGKDLLGLPEEMSAALSIQFDREIGHDYFENAELRYDLLHKKENRIPFHLEMLNRITHGGVPTKTLTAFMSNTTGGFKTGTMTDWAAFLISQGHDVLYITMEMAEEFIAQRVDANLMNIEIDNLHDFPKPLYMQKIEALRAQYTGKLIVKQFPTSAAHAGHFRNLIKDLQQKMKFQPKVIFIDYLNICASSRMDPSKCNSYTYIKSIAEELRGLAIETDAAIVTGTQGKRDAIGSSDVDMGDVSESIGLPFTLDLMLAIITTDALENAKQLMFKQLKNRYGDLNYYNTFLVGVNKAKMKLYDVDSSRAPVGVPNANSSALANESGDISGMHPSSGEKFDGFQY